MWSSWECRPHWRWYGPWQAPCPTRNGPEGESAAGPITTATPAGMRVCLSFFLSFYKQQLLPFWIVSAGWPCLCRPFWTVWFLLLGRVGTSPDALGRAGSSAADFWKREAVLHWCCHSTKPWGEKTSKGGTWMEKMLVAVWGHLILKIRFTVCSNQRKKGSSFLFKCCLWFLQRCDFERQKASLLKQQYLCNSPLFGKEASSNNRRESNVLSE